MVHRYLPYTLELRAPVILAAAGSDPNSTRTLPYIPGSALRGAAARALGDPGANPARQHDFRALILAGSVRWLNAYPRAGGRRALPTPVSFRVNKNEIESSEGAIRVLDLAASVAHATAQWPEEPLIPLAERFVTLGATQPLRVEPRRRSRIHHQRDRARGRAWTEERDGREEAHGAVFAFEFLDAGQEFEGIVLVQGESESRCDDLADRVRACLAGPLLLGRSRRAGYGGQAAVTWHAPRPREVVGEELVQRDIPPGTIFRALLTSAYIGRSPATGQIDPTRLEAEVVAALASGDAGEEPMDRVRVLGRCWAFEVVGGFNRKQRVEVPQALACVGGSVLVLEATAPIPLADLLAVEHAGLGERRAEGFGRVAFLEKPTEAVVLRRPPMARVGPPTADPPELARFVEWRILDRVVQRVIAEEAARLAEPAKPRPTASLIARLRNALRQEPAAALGTLRDWCAQEGSARLRRPAMDQLERCRIGSSSERLSDWVRKLTRERADTERYAAELLRLETIAQRYYVISESSARRTLRARDTLMRARLIDATLAALARASRVPGSRHDDVR